LLNETGTTYGNDRQLIKGSGKIPGRERVVTDFEI
jgi:hypothetical protein